VISKRTIDDVLQVAQVDEVISDFMTIKRKGANYEGLCPFHNEKTPSFKVNPAKGLYKCFGCGKAGGSVQFVMDHEGMSFIESVKYLAKKYGIEIIEDKTQRSQEYDEQTKRRESLFAALQYAQDYYQSQLMEEEGKIAGLAYFKERGFTNETIQTFGLGYAPQGYETFTKSAIDMGFRKEILVDAGLVKTNEKGNTYDFFRQRVTFPFHNISGKVIAFGARILVKNDKAPKYLNSPESEVYFKSKTLYGIFQAKNEIKKEDNCLLVEGYTDVISLHQSGIKNVVASSGTSLTQDQAALIARFSPNVTILYDGDAAGIKASLRGINILLEQGLNVRVLTFTEGEDPDSFAQKHEPAYIKKYISEKQEDFVLFKSKLLYEEAQNDPIRKADANAEIIKTIAIVPNPLIRAQYIQEFAKISNLSDELIQAEVSKARNKEFSDAVKHVNTDLAYIHQQQQELNIHKSNVSIREKTTVHEIAIANKIIKHAQKPYNEKQSVAEYIISEIIKDESKFQEENVQLIIQWTTDQLEVGEPVDFQQFIFTASPEVASFVANMLDDPYTLSPNWEKNEIIVASDSENYIRDVFETVFYLKYARLRVLMEKTVKQLQNDLTQDEKNKIIRTYKQLLEARTFFQKHTGGVIL
jgi:DNA primase